MASISTNVTVRQATPDDAGRLIGVLAETFLHDPVADWLIPDHDDRRFISYRYFTHIVGHGLQYGHVDMAADGSAAAIWYPRPEPSPAVAADHRVGVREATGTYAPKFVLIETMLESHHPPEVHHYLAYAAVSPGHQGRGTGTALLSNHHQQIDPLGMPAYVHATSTRNRDLYLRLGYLPGPSMVLPDGGPKIWRMWRAPLGITIPASFFTPHLSDR
ncbi:GNAT family N-acetyltransferase [Micromonospora lupini]|uniref:GCN5-related N-acetyltransferase n=1 Tax=Micromonospora lupini str. Lupac 08 TaxID=1150864 RepID=I0L1S6_9ACTN|nr:GNAT family N-acetyltransferase [Micromonospora lupini]CCH17773.1 GCN5-related N-acetyltransferase [Micromonospora lupini str. Lupac 08]